MKHHVKNRKVALKPPQKGVKGQTVRKKTEHFFERMFKEEAKQFCLNTALHGYKFIVLPKRILLERVVWVIVCIVALIAALTLLFIAWISFKRNPTVIVTDSNHYSIWNYHFPAITICDYNIISKKRAFQLAKKLLNSSDNNSVENLAWDLRLLAQLLKQTDVNVPEKNFNRLQDILDANNLSVNAVFKQLTPRCENILTRCLWKGEEKRCESIFEQIKTSEGYCCAFNYYALKNHTFGGCCRALASKVPRQPRRVSACGHQSGLEILVNSDPSDYFASFMPSIGQKLMIHNPYYYPDWTLQTVLNSRRILNLISVSPTITYCTNDVAEMPSETRRCLLPNERDLIYFKDYNFHNCMVECRMNMTMKLCNCTPFVYVHSGVNASDVKICNLRDVKCLREHQKLLISDSLGQNATSSDFTVLEKVTGRACGCLPDCESTEYYAETSSGALNFKYIRSNAYTDVKITNDSSILNVYFNDLVGIKNRMDVKFDWHTLLAYYGGLLGLFLGFSFVSGVEIIYFFVVRLTTGLVKKQKEKKKKAVRRALTRPERLTFGWLE
nr:unnamed protein product [Callosobruchus analis]